MSDGIVTEDEFPHGLRCAVCDGELLPGERYAESRSPNDIGGLPVVYLVCIEDAGKLPEGVLPGDMEQAMDDAATLARMEGEP